MCDICKLNENMDNLLEFFIDFLEFSIEAIIE